jgi:hypothetical protein
MPADANDCSMTISDPGESSESVLVVLGRMRARREEIARAICVRVQEAVPDEAAARDPDFQAGMLPTVTALLDYRFQALERGPAFSAALPPQAAAQARRAARAHVKLGTVLRRYLAGHRCLGEFVAQEAERAGLDAGDPALQRLRLTQEAVLERLTAAIEGEYERERARDAGSPAGRSVELVRTLLDGQPLGGADLASLAYRFDAWHVGLVATGAGAAAALDGLGAGRRLLRVCPEEQIVWAWFAAPRRPAHSDMQRLLAGRDRSGFSLAVGEPAQGMEGWRQTHRQAQLALRATLHCPRARMRYADVALLAPWLEDERRARSLIEIYLSPLEECRDDGAGARRTLSAYFRAARNVSAAARQLGVDRRTVSYRLRMIEERLGYPLEDRVAELEVALRLHCLLEGRGGRGAETA